MDVLVGFWNSFKRDVKKNFLWFFFYLVWVALAFIVPWLGIQSLLLFVEGNRDPSLPLSTPCAVLNSSMMPDQYDLERTFGWHYRTRVKLAGLDIVAEHRCFNFGSGSTFLYLNNQLVAFSRVRLDIYDCHGQRLWDTAYDSYIDKKLKLKVYDHNGKYIWASDIPAQPSELLVYGQPDDIVVATISTKPLSRKSSVTIKNAESPAADPRLIIMLLSTPTPSPPPSFSLLQPTLAT
jgi:hypothetical protein